MSCPVLGQSRRLPAGRAGVSLALGLVGVLSLPIASCATEAPLPRLAPVVPSADGPFGFRDPRVGRPGTLTSGGRDERALVLALEKLRNGQTEAASRAFREGARTAVDPLPFELGGLYAELASGRLDEARPGLEALLAKEPRWSAAAEARADLLYARGELREALDRYRAALKLLPADPRLTDRLEAVKAGLAAVRRRDGEAALATGDFDGARRAGLSLLELDPRSAFAVQLLSRAAAASGKYEDAWDLARKAEALSQGDPAWAEFAASLAEKTGRFGEAASLYERLGEAEKAEEARLEFRIQNLPEVARRAALSTRVTRAQLAVLAWWTVPEVRDAQGTLTPDVAVDAVDRPERQAIIRSIGLGFFTVSRDTHRVGADVAVSRTELASVLRRVAGVAGRGRKLGPGCLSANPPTVASLVECGILWESGARTVVGREALLALERAARMGREGGTK